MLNAHDQLIVALHITPCMAPKTIFWFGTRKTRHHGRELASDDNHYWKMALPIWSDKILTHCGRVMHICASDITIIDPHNGLSPDWHQAIICPNDMLLLIRPQGTKFVQIFNRNS